MHTSVLEDEMFVVSTTVYVIIISVLHLIGYSA